MEENLSTLYESFLTSLKAKRDRERIALLVLGGISELQLVHAFVNHIYKETQGRCYAIRDVKVVGPIIDLCLVRDSFDSPTIFGLVEAKHITKRIVKDSYSPKSNVYSALFGGDPRRKVYGKEGAFDSYSGLFHQTGSFKGSGQDDLRIPRRISDFWKGPSFWGELQDDFGMQFSKSVKSIYGMVFASHVAKGEKNSEKKRAFYRYVVNEAKGFFQGYDSDMPDWGRSPLFEDVHLRVLDTDFFCTLKVGLWKRPEVGKEAQDLLRRHRPDMVKLYDYRPWG